MRSALFAFNLSLALSIHLSAIQTSNSLLPFSPATKIRFQQRKQYCSRFAQDMLADPQPTQTGVAKHIEWIIRPSTLKDEIPITKIMFDSYSSLLQADYEADTLKKVVPLISKPRPELLICGTWYVAEHPDTHKLVGCGGWTKANPDKKGDINEQEQSTMSSPPHLRHFATCPSATRQGVASAIWSKCVQEISKECHPDTALEVFSTLSAQKFYASLGFELIEYRDIALGDINFPCAFMRRPPPISWTQLY